MGSEVLDQKEVLAKDSAVEFVFVPVSPRGRSVREFKFVDSLPKFKSGNKRRSPLFLFGRKNEK